jgi:hypothetical protein
MASKARDIADLGSNDVLETTATGLDVTGTVTADGVEVDGLLHVDGSDNSNVAKFALTRTDSSWSVNNETNFRIYGGTGDTTSPSTKRFEIGTNGDIQFYEDTGTTAKFVWDASAESLNLGSTSSIYESAGGDFFIKDTNSGADVFIDSGRRIRFNANGSERMRIDSSGNVGLRGTGVTSEDVVNKLDFYSTTSSMNLAGIQGRRTAGGTNYGSLIFTTTSGGSSTEKARLDSSGNFMVGTTNATQWNKTTGKGFVINGSSGGVQIAKQSVNSIDPVLIVNRTGSTSGTILDFRYSGSFKGGVTIDSTSVSYNTSSDERLKENIQDTTHTVDINDIQVREFDWKVDGSHQRYGFIAQELETVYPEAVHSPEDADEMMSVDYSKLIPLLVKEIQTLKARIETLENN